MEKVFQIRADSDLDYKDGTIGKENGYIFGTFFRGKGEGLAGGLEHCE